MSKRAYVLVRKGAVVEIARPLQGSLKVYPISDSFVKPMLSYAWPGDGVWLAKLRFPKAKMAVDSLGKKPVSVAKKIAELKKKLGAGMTAAGTDAPGILGYQHRADAAASAQRSRWREAEGLLAWLKKLHEDAGPGLAEAIEVFREAKAKPTVAAVAEHIKWLLARRKKMGVTGAGGIDMTEFMSQYDGDGTSAQVQALLRSKAAEVGKAAGLKNLRLEKGRTVASAYDKTSMGTLPKGVARGRHKRPAQIIWGS